MLPVCDAPSLQCARCLPGVAPLLSPWLAAYRASLTAAVAVHHGNPRLVEQRSDLAGGYFTSDAKARIDLDVLHRFLSEESTWARGRSRAIVEKSLERSLAIGLYAPDGSMAGFARAVTDFATSARLCDVFVLRAHRGQGLSIGLVRATLEHPSLATVVAWTLTTEDMHILYAKFGFAPLVDPSKTMAWRRVSAG